ncbi:actin family [Thamnocephalis sphaerospora]|uniref:Actin family n=1 Tax=Thamnocephalis sphaerospora TaxID=78915 RepID=A0A4P9XWW5_9FUNG|nr:actin family [Thamnocephalis sphaerospora]|eukprot:RKP10767.1 actin family [Thamnocephalis sphaerospora]
MDPLRTPRTTRMIPSSSLGRTTQTPLGSAGPQLSQLLPRPGVGSTLPGIGGAGAPYLGRRHSIYGTEDRIVLDVGSLYLRCGFSGESQPRHILSVSGDLAFHRDGPCNECCRHHGRFVELFTPNVGQADPVVLEETLRHYLYDVFYRYLLTDPRQRKVLICESPLMPTEIKNMLARILFQSFQVPSLSFVPSPILSLMTAGVMTGLVLDSGNWETTVMPLFDLRPLTSSVRATPLAGRALSERLRILLLNYAQLILPTGERTRLESAMLDAETLEDLKTRILFVSPFNLIRPDGGPTPSQEGDDFEGWYRDASAATDVTCRLRRADTGQACRLLVPGWVRERAAEVLFVGDEDAPDLVCCLLDCLLKVNVELRPRMVEHVLLTGGTVMLPNFQARFHQECIRMASTHPRYRPLQSLMDRMRFLSGGERGRIFPANCRAWIGGSLVGVLKASGPEITKEKFTGVVPDWAVPELEPSES